MAEGSGLPLLKLVFMMPSAFMIRTRGQHDDSFQATEPQQAITADDSRLVGFQRQTSHTEKFGLMAMHLARAVLRRPALLLCTITAPLAGSVTRAFLPAWKPFVLFFLDVVLTYDFTPPTASNRGDAVGKVGDVPSRRSMHGDEKRVAVGGRRGEWLATPPNACNCVAIINQQLLSTVGPEAGETGREVTAAVQLPQRKPEGEVGRVLESHDPEWCGGRLRKAGRRTSLCKATATV
ncbi:hypothetical protein QBC36DRAFT_362158 [Triangularia setosa]|uniref:Uncharacterized protein n=1 Tax=Triangularia setosa TaxID=2587417 RepID=A0AAN7A458_9PEZI|nr:hypothetical protein QBC36DRAFT_362158 [Podospora setosa]